MELYEALSAHKKNARISFPELSTLCGVPVSTLKKIFSGVTSNPPFDTVLSIAHAMGISADDLIKETSQFSSSDLSSAALDFARKYDTLDAHGRRVVDFLLNEEAARVASSPVARTPEEEAEDEALYDRLRAQADAAVQAESESLTG